MNHKYVVEAAVIGKSDLIKGEIPIGFAVLQKDINISHY